LIVRAHRSFTDFVVDLAFDGKPWSGSRWPLYFTAYAFRNNRYM